MCPTVEAVDGFQSPMTDEDSPNTLVPFEKGTHDDHDAVEKAALATELLD